MRQSIVRLGGHHAPIKYVRHAPPPPPKIHPGYKWASKAVGAAAWFWIFYRIKEDGYVMTGLKLPFEH